LSQTPLSARQREEGEVFAPKFDESGLLTAVVLDAQTKAVLMVAFMNEAALQQTRETGKVTLWSRSRRKLWMKGESSGNVLTVSEILVDCDQDALVIYATPAGPRASTAGWSPVPRTRALSLRSKVDAHVKVR
jgi:phosphoribosyl-AMP cyclohydrolase